jgi:hypothetical protein
MRASVAVTRREYNDRQIYFDPLAEKSQIIYTAEVKVALLC